MSNYIAFLTFLYEFEVCMFMYKHCFGKHLKSYKKKEMNG
jgi:hypothetical protein